MASNGSSNPQSSRLSAAQSGIAPVRDNQSTKDSTRKSFAEFYREYRARKKAKFDDFSRDFLKRRKTVTVYQHEHKVRKEDEKLKQSEHDTRLLDSINIDPYKTAQLSTRAEKSRIANSSTSDRSSTSDSKIASNAKNRGKSSAAKQRDYRAREKAKYGNIPKKTTEFTTTTPSTTANSHTNHAPSTSAVTTSKERRRREIKAEYLREYRKRLKSRRVNNSLNSTSGRSTASAKSSSTIAGRTKNQTSVNIDDASRENIPRNENVDDTRTDHDTRINQKPPLTNHSPSKRGISIKSRRRKLLAQYQREYRQLLKARRIRNSLNSTRGGSTARAKSSSTITERKNDQTNVNIKNANRATRTDHETQSDPTIKLLLTNHSPSKSEARIANKPSRQKSAAQYQPEYQQGLKARPINNAQPSSAIIKDTNDQTDGSIEDASVDDVPRNKNTNNTRTDHDTRSKSHLPPTNHGPSEEGVIIPNGSPRREPAAQSQRSYRQRLRSRRIDSSLNSTPDGSTADAKSSPTIIDRTRVPVVILEPLVFNRKYADPASETSDDLRPVTLSRPRSIAERRENVTLNEEFFESMRKTNVLQRSMSLEIIDHLASDQHQPLRVFLKGASGRGKTFVIRLILELYHKHATTNAHCNAYLICASTGKAAVAINGPTVHTALSLSTGVGSGLSVEILQQFRSLFEHIRVVIIDEVSSVGTDLLDRLDGRLKLITGKSDLPFGGLDIVLIGDLRAPPPVKAKPIHRQSKPRIDSQTWRSFKFHQVTEVIRQSNALFSAILTKISSGDRLSKEETTLLESTFVTEEEANRLCPHGLRLAYFNKTVDVYNRLITKNEQEKIMSEAVDFISGCGNDEECENACRALENRKLAADTGGLLQSLTFVLGKYYTIATNVAVADGLVKGTVGKLAHIEINDDGEVARVWLLFPACEAIGLKSRTAMSEFMTANDINPLAVPIDRRDETFYLDGQRTISVKRNHFPIAPGCSLKIKKAQTGSFDEVVYYYDKSQSKQLVYGAMSRVSSVEGLYIIPVNKRTEFYHGYASDDRSCVDSQNEMTRLHRSSLDLLKHELLETVDSKSGLSLV